jgi:hypothetical protein
MPAPAGRRCMQPTSTGHLPFLFRPLSSQHTASPTLLHRQKKFTMCAHARAQHCRFAREASGHRAPWLLPACPMPSLAPPHVSSLHESCANDSSAQMTLSCCLVTWPPHRRLSAARLAPAPPPAPLTRPCALPSSRLRAGDAAVSCRPAAAPPLAAHALPRCCPAAPGCHSAGTRRSAVQPPAPPPSRARAALPVSCRALCASWASVAFVRSKACDCWRCAPASAGAASRPLPGFLLLCS